MKLNFDGWKHALGYASVVLAPAAGSYLATSKFPHAPLLSAGSVLALGLVAFFCGAQSEKVLASEAEVAVKALVDDSSKDVTKP